MALRHVPVTRIAALAGLVVAAVLIGRKTPGLHWRSLRPGAECAGFSGDPFCKRGAAEIAALRLVPARVRLRIRHYSQLPARRPLNILEWEGQTGALAAFNAGQFYEDYSYMGL